MKIVVLKNNQEQGPFTLGEINHQLNAGGFVLNDSARMEESMSYTTLALLLSQIYTPRKHGIRLMLIGGIVFAALIVASIWILPQFGLGLGLTSGLPCTCFFMGLLEAATNKPFSYWGERWNALKGWKKALLGTSIALAFFVGGLAILFAIVMWLN